MAKLALRIKVAPTLMKALQRDLLAQMLQENLFFVVPICVLGIPANGTNDADFFFQQQTLIMLWFLTTLSL